MATQGPPPGQPLPQHIQQMIAMEAQKRGMTIPQFQAFQRQQIEQEAAKAGMSPQQFVQMKQEEARQQFMQQQAAQQQAGQGQQPQGQGQVQGQGQAQSQGQSPQGQPQGHVQHIPVNQGVEPTPQALAVAKFLRSQDLKTRTCIFNGQRKDMFKVKRAFRALHSDAYKKACAKNSLLPKVENDQDARTAVQLLPLSMLALRVSKKDPHEGHNHPKPKKEKRVKGLWDVKIEQQQEFEPMMHYVWLYEGPQWKTMVWSGLALVAVFTVVLFPLWPLFMRQGVWYLSVGAMGLLGLFFAMSIFRLILFCVTYFVASPGLWLFPNLFEDVGFFESFVPVWGWQEPPKKKKRSKKIAGVEGSQEGAASVPVGSSPSANGDATSSGVISSDPAGALVKRHATVEEAEDD